MSHQSPPDSLLTDSAAAAEAAFKKFAVESWVLTSLAILICALRTYARVRAVGVRDLCLDDYMVWVGVVRCAKSACYTTLTSLAYCAGTMAKGLANTGMTDAERTALSPIDVEYHSSYAIRIRIGFVFLASSYFTLVMTFFFSCRPFHKYWQINPNPGSKLTSMIILPNDKLIVTLLAVCQPTISTPLLWTNFVLNASTDIYIMSIPIPLLWKSGLKIAKKIFMTILLGAGVFILACALLRVILVELVSAATFLNAWVEVFNVLLVSRYEPAG
ncbi:hypothetical protein VFPPC_18279 [Pochonia chlamydosporia 170]|uniref:Rhodopsin domain-containing protein n=1 Tax=Pochonia chlamydosporia 170 TaxID=1380566 RepID=A0A219AP31_METCM|nr:hypothetical protein VFPPC_18279 [Pochonia chlamydosporia 170]OWT42588.1 hypothetical protein VFPPC_18279 [Pochonia chlamydosporia 170]